MSNIHAFLQQEYNKGYEKGRADGRAEVIEKIRRYVNTHRYSNDDLIEFLEQLKEHNNDNYEDIGKSKC